ncbi:zf-HC2 domain-containing protein [Derxia lacustris]|uniref:zf-HC2 domain-containing protein n=1 Tax=Derxia lacustris TaxID=764842 RepID=UPI000A17817E|nr:zf-HC2 domain-containing protein [Derxia lacustris]
MLNCREAARLMSEAQDRKLGVGETLGLRFHLALCENCMRYREQLAVMRRALRRYRDDRHDDGTDAG